MECASETPSQPIEAPIDASADGVVSVHRNASSLLHKSAPREQVRVSPPQPLISSCEAFSRLQSAVCRLQTTDCRLQTADYRLQTADCRPQPGLRQSSEESRGPRVCPHACRDTCNHPLGFSMPFSHQGTTLLAHPALCSWPPRVPLVQSSSMPDWPLLGAPPRPLELCAPVSMPPNFPKTPLASRASSPPRELYIV